MRLAFDEAVAALSMVEVDTMGPTLQAEDHGAGGLRPAVNLREDTRIRQTKALALVPAFFSKEVAEAFGAVFSARLSLKNIPNQEYYERRAKFMTLLSLEMHQQPKLSLARFVFWK